MILTCPDCSARFAVEAEKLGPDGRRVKCGKCGHVWFESTPVPDPEDQAEPVTPVTPLEPGEQSTIPVRNLPAIRQVQKARSARTGWMVSVVLLAAILAALWFGRAHIARAVPQMEAVYAAVGIAAFPLPGEGLRIDFDPKTEDGVLSLRGEIINISDGVRDVPGLEVVISDASQVTLKSWDFTSDVRRLGPGETVAFTTQTDNVPEGAANVSISFTNSGDNR